MNKRQSETRRVERQPAGEQSIVQHVLSATHENGKEEEGKLHVRFSYRRSPPPDFSLPLYGVTGKRLQRAVANKDTETVMQIMRGFLCDPRHYERIRTMAYIYDRSRHFAMLGKVVYLQDGDGSDFHWNRASHRKTAMGRLEKRPIIVELPAELTSRREIEDYLWEMSYRDSYYQDESDSDSESDTGSESDSDSEDGDHVLFMPDHNEPAEGCPMCHHWQHYHRH